MALGIEQGQSQQEIAATLAADEQIQASLFETLVRAHMGGQLFVRAVEVPESLPKRVLAIPDARPSFLRMPFQEALDAFLEKNVMTPEAFQALTDALRQRSFTATGLAAESLVQRAFDTLSRQLAEGGSLQSFVADMRAGELSLGVEAATPHALENIYRTSTQTAYGQGRLAQLEHPAVAAARPLVQYRTVKDSRVRPRHAALEGVVFDRSKDEGWREFAPPLGFSCRCAMVVVRQADTITDSATLKAAGLGADPGFTSPGTI